MASSTIDSATLRFFRSALLIWFNENGRRFVWRRRQASKYLMIVSETLLQRTRASTVEAFLPRFLDRFPGWSQLASAPLAQIEEALRPIGLSHRRACTLQGLGRALAHRNGRFPRRRADIDQLPGVGQYIGNAIELFCHEEARPLLDAGMARLLERFFHPRELIDIRYDPFLQQLAKRIVRCAKPRQLNWAMLDYAALVCTRTRPSCSSCVLSRRCRAA